MSTTTQHTPGPWHIGIRPGPFIYGPKGEQVANMLPALMDPEENSANARLIAAAPELLEALLALDDAAMGAMGMEPGKQPPVSRIGRAILDARAAIAKATGKAQP